MTDSNSTSNKRIMLHIILIELTIVTIITVKWKKHFLIIAFTYSKIRDGSENTYSVYVKAAHFNFFFESIWIMLNQIFRDFDQKNLNHFLGQTSPIFGANKYEKKAKCGLEISGLLTQITRLWGQISIEFVQLRF